MWMRKDEVHQYDNIQSLEFSVENDNLRRFITVTLPTNGKVTLHLDDLFMGKFPKEVKVQCSEGYRKDDYREHTTVPCPTPPAVAP